MIAWIFNDQRHRALSNGSGGQIDHQDIGKWHHERGQDEDLVGGGEQFLKRVANKAGARRHDASPEITVERVSVRYRIAPLVDDRKMRRLGSFGH